MRFGLGQTVTRWLRKLSDFLPSSISGLQLWLDATDTDTINSKMGADFVSANSESLSSTNNIIDVTQDFTFIFWQKTSIYNNKVSWILGGAGDYCLYGSMFSEKFYIYLSNDGTTVNSAGTHNIGENVVTDTWQMWTFKHEVATKKFSVKRNDGSYVDTTYTGTLNVTSLGFRLGFNTTGCFTGTIDGVGIWNGLAMSDAQTDAIYNSGNGVSYDDLTTDSLTSLVSYWELNELSGTRFDEHGSNNLTDNNTVSYALGHIQEPIANNGYVWRWTDKSDNAYNFDQDTASTQPQYVSTGLGTNNKPHLLFDGTDRSLETAIGIDGSTAYTSFCVVDLDGTYVIALAGTNKYTTAISSTDIYTRNDAGYDSALTAGTTSPVVVTNINSGGTDMDLYKNNVLLATNYTAGADTSDFTLIGKTDGGLFTDGKIGEILFYNRVLTSGEITQVSNYLNSKYGIY